MLGCTNQGEAGRACACAKLGMINVMQVSGQVCVSRCRRWPVCPCRGECFCWAVCVPVEERVAVQSSMCVWVPRAHVTVSLWVHMGDCLGGVAKCESVAGCDWLQGQLVEGLRLGWVGS